MTMREKKPWWWKTAPAAALSAAALGLSACGTAADEPGTDVEGAQEQPAAQQPGPYAGPYDEAFAEDVAAHADEEVVLTAEVDTIVSPVAFTITSADDPGVAPLLVVNFDADAAGPEEGEVVEVTGRLHEAYNVPTVEEDIGRAPAEDLLAHYDGQPFVHATNVEDPEPQATASAG